MELKEGPIWKSWRRRLILPRHCYLLLLWVLNLQNKKRPRTKTKRGNSYVPRSCPTNEFQWQRLWHSWAAATPKENILNCRGEKIYQKIVRNQDWLLDKGWKRRQRGKHSALLRLFFLSSILFILLPSEPLCLYLQEEGEQEACDRCAGPASHAPMFVRPQGCESGDVYLMQTHTHLHTQGAEEDQVFCLALGNTAGLLFLWGFFFIDRG